MTIHKDNNLEAHRNSYDGNDDMDDIDRANSYVKEPYEYCFEDMLCVECGAELDYRPSDGNECECYCHTLL